jgi:ABC-type antimicrobial peptide transport system ATPase subunit
LFLSLGCTKKVINFVQKDIKFFYNGKEEIIKDVSRVENYIIDTLSLKHEDTEIFILVEDFGSGVHIIEVKIFSKVKKNWVTSLEVKNIKTSKVYFKIDEKNERLIINSKSGIEIISLPLSSLILKGDAIFRDD